MGDVRDVPVPDFGRKHLAELSEVYVDSAVGGVLGLDSALVSHARTELSKEPMVTKRRHDSWTLT